MFTPLIRTCIIVPGLCALAACGPYVKSDVNPALVGTVHCGTFAWAGAFRGNSPLRSTIASPINESLLRTAIAAHLGARVQNWPANVDCLVGYGIGSTYVVDAGWPYYGYPYGWWGYPYGAGPYVYREGIIGIDLYDARSGQPLWHATVDQSLYGVSAAEAEKRINAAVAALFTKYPGNPARSSG